MRRTREYIELTLTQEKAERLFKGYTVGCMLNGQAYSISTKQRDPKLAKIERLEAELRALREEVTPKKRKFSPAALEKMRACAAHARAVRAAKRSNV